MKRKTTVIIISVLAALCIMAGIAWLYAFGSYDGADVRVNIPAGSTQADIRDRLTSQGGGFGSRVYNLWKLQGGKPATAHGSYVIADGMTALQASRMLLQDGRRRSTSRSTICARWPTSPGGCLTSSSAIRCSFSPLPTAF